MKQFFIKNWFVLLIVVGFVLCLLQVLEARAQCKRLEEEVDSCRAQLEEQKRRNGIWNRFKEVCRTVQCTAVRWLLIWRLFHP